MREIELYSSTFKRLVWPFKDGRTFPASTRDLPLHRKHLVLLVEKRRYADFFVRGRTRPVLVERVENNDYKMTTHYVVDTTMVARLWFK